MNTMDFPDAREFFESISSYILPTEKGGQLDVFAPLAASGGYTKGSMFWPCD